MATKPSDAAHLTSRLSSSSTGARASAALRPPILPSAFAASHRTCSRGDVNNPASAATAIGPCPINARSARRRLGILELDKESISNWSDDVPAVVSCSARASWFGSISNLSSQGIYVHLVTKTLPGNHLFPLSILLLIFISCIIILHVCPRSMTTGILPVLQIRPDFTDARNLVHRMTTAPEKGDIRGQKSGMRSNSGAHSWSGQHTTLYLILA